MAFSELATVSLERWVLHLYSWRKSVFLQFEETKKRYDREW